MSNEITTGNQDYQQLVKLRQDFAAAKRRNDDEEANRIKAKITSIENFIKHKDDYQAAKTITFGGKKRKSRKRRRKPKRKSRKSRRKSRKRRRKPKRKSRKRRRR